MLVELVVCAQMAEYIPPLLSKQVVFDALASERAANGIAKHQTYSMDQMLEHHLPSIILEQPEIVSDMPTSIHVVQFNHVHIDKPVARTQGGFYDWIDADAARTARHTLANPIVLDATHCVFSSNAPVKEASWEALDAHTIDAEVCGFLTRLELYIDFLTIEF